MRFQVRPPFGVEPFDLDLDDRNLDGDDDDAAQMTVRELRDRLRQASAGLAALGDGDQLRLVFGGRVLAGADVPLADYGITRAGGTLHVVRAPSSSSQPSDTAQQQKPPSQAAKNTTHPFGLDEDAMRDMMQSPMMQSMLNNTDLLSQMLQSNPQTQRMLERNPEMRQMLTDPQFLRQMSAEMRNPNLLKERMRHVDRALVNIENIPGGFTHLTSMLGDMRGDGSGLQDAPMGEDRSPAAQEQRNQAMARRLNVQPVSPDGINAEALPNPWEPRRNQQTQQQQQSGASLWPGGGNTDYMQMLMSSLFTNNNNNNNSNNQGFGSGGQLQPSQQRPWPMMMPMFPPAAAATQSLPQQPPAPASQPATVHPDYTQQLRDMHEMGFTDDELNRLALQETGGQLDPAVIMVVEWLGLGDDDADADMSESKPAAEPGAEPGPENKP